MLNRLIFLLALVLSFSAEADTPNPDSSVTLTGTKEQVAAILQNAISAEFTGVSISNAQDRPGIVARFKSFWTGQTELTAWLVPLVDNDSLEATAHRIDFGYRTQHMDGKQHVTSAITRIKALAEKEGLTVVTNYSDYRTLPEQSDRCLKALVDDPELKALKGKIAFDTVDHQTFEMLANDSFPTEDERKAIYLYGVKRSVCLSPRKAFVAFWPGNPYGPLFNSVLDSADQLVLALYKGQLSYGNFAKIRKETYTKFLEAQQKVAAELKAQDSAANDRAQRIAIEQQRLMLEQQKTFAEMYKPVPVQMPAVPATTLTHCNFYGNQVNCTTN